MKKPLFLPLYCGLKRGLVSGGISVEKWVLNCKAPNLPPGSLYCCFKNIARAHQAKQSVIFILCGAIECGAIMRYHRVRLYECLLRLILACGFFLNDDMMTAVVACYIVCLILGSRKNLGEFNACIIAHLIKSPYKILS